MASATPITSPRLFAPGAVSTADPEFATSFAPDGATVYFDRANADRSKLIIVSSTYANGAWQPAAPLPFSTGEFRDVVDPRRHGPGTARQLVPPASGATP